MAIRLVRLLASTKIADGEGRPTQAFQRYWQQFAEQIERALTLIGDFLGITDELAAAISQASQAAQDAAQAAADAAAAAQVAQEQAAGAAFEQALVNSYTDPADGLLSATPVTITVAAHNRVYGDGTSVAVEGGTVAATAAGDTDYVSYEDADHSGGSVSYVASTAAPTQGMGVHVVAAVTIPATGTANGGRGPRRPGEVEA